RQVADAVDELAAVDGDGAAVGRVRDVTHRELLAELGRSHGATGEQQGREALDGGRFHARGMNSWLSKSGSFMRFARQSALACSIRSRDEETKFHSMKRSPTGSPPSAMIVDGRTARTELSSPSSNTSILPAPKRLPRTSISPAATYNARSGYSAGKAAPASGASSQCA